MDIVTRRASCRLTTMLCAIMMAAQPCSAQEPTARDLRLDSALAFARAAESEDSLYIVARDYILAHGGRFRPVLVASTKSDDWRRRDMAKALLLKLDHGGRVNAWELAVAGKREITLGAEGKAVVAIPDGDPARKSPHIPKSGQVVFDRNAIPFLNEQLRLALYHAERGYGGAPIAWQNVIRLIGHFRDASSAEVLADGCGRLPKQLALLERAISNLGEPAAAALRQVIATAPNRKFYRGSMPTHVSQRGNRHIRRAVRAAEILGKMKDAKSAPLLIAMLKSEPFSQQSVAYIKALAAIGDAQGVSPAIELLGEYTAYSPVRSRSQSSDYGEIRAAITSFGARAIPELKRLTAAEHPLVKRVLASGLLYELENEESLREIYRDFQAEYAERWQSLRPRNQTDEQRVAEGKRWCWTNARRGHRRELPLPLLAERAVAFAAGADLEKLCYRGGEFYIRIAAQGLVVNRYVDREGSDLALALGSTRNEIVLPAFRELLRPDRPARYSVRVVEGLLALGSKKGAPLLEELINKAVSTSDRYYKQAAETAKVILPVLKGDQPITALRHHNNRSIRLIVAKQLAREGDLSAMQMLLPAAVTSKGTEYHRIRKLLLSLGGRALPTLRRRMMSTADARERLYCEALIVTIERPKVAELVTRAALIRSPGFQKRAGPGIGDYRIAGYRMAEFIGEEAIPLLEAAVTFESDEIDPGIAAFALAKFKKERSIAAIQYAMRTRGFVHGGGSAAAEALKEFGDKGKAAAKAIPAPDPNKSAFAGRARRSVGATKILADSGEKKSVENILQALAKVYKRDEKPLAESWTAWRSRIIAFMSIAQSLNDQRLVEPLLNFAKHSDDALADAAFKALARYEDPRVVSLALARLPNSTQWYRRSLLKLLVQRQRGQLPKTLLNLLLMSESTWQRVGIIRSVEALIGKQQWSAIATDSSQVAKYQQATRQVFEAKLIELLKAKPQEVQIAAARALAHYLPQNKTVVKAVAEWIATAKSPDQVVIDFLVKSNSQFAKSGILKCYVSGDRSNGALAAALGRLDSRPALGDLILGLQTALKKQSRYDCRLELQAVARFGEEGQKVVRDVIHGDFPLVRRVRAAKILSESRHDASFTELAQILHEITVKGIQHPGLPQQQSERKRSSRLQSMLLVLAEGLIYSDANRSYFELTRAALETPHYPAASYLGGRAMYVRHYLLKKK